LNDEMLHLIPFNPEERMREVQEMHAQMLSIRNGKFLGEEFNDLEKYDFNTFQAMDEVEDFFDDYTFKIDSTKQSSKQKRQARKKKKVVSFVAGNNDN
jgi:hypothetical protein